MSVLSINKARLDLAVNAPENFLDQSILDDFSIEHTNVSIKIETHPYYQLQCVSIHPCKHADVMKKLIKAYYCNRWEYFNLFSEN